MTIRGEQRGTDSMEAFAPMTAAARLPLGSSLLGELLLLIGP